MLLLSSCLFLCVLHATLDFQMDELKDHEICIKFGLELRKTSSEMREMLRTAFSDNVVGRTQAFEWFSRFRPGETLVGDSEHSCCPSTGHTGGSVESLQNDQ
jgi:hypothetical protein